MDFFQEFKMLFLDWSPLHFKIIFNYSYHVDFLIAEELCNEAGAYLSDILDSQENNFIKGVLNAVNPKVCNCYYIIF